MDISHLSHTHLVIFVMSLILIDISCEHLTRRVRNVYTNLGHKEYYNNNYLGQEVCEKSARCHLENKENYKMSAKGVRDVYHNFGHK
jgi:hypothetical protein